jgi:RNA recognition motif-containing protein
MGNRLYIGNLPFSAGELDLQNHFAASGQVRSCRIMIDRDTGRSRGFGFVTMSTDAEAQRAISELNGFDFQGRRLLVNEARERDPNAPARSPTAPPMRDATQRPPREFSTPRPPRDPKPYPEVSYSNDGFPDMPPVPDRSRRRAFNNRRRSTEEFDE